MFDPAQLMGGAAPTKPQNTQGARTGNGPATGAAGKETATDGGQGSARAAKIGPSPTSSGGVGSGAGAGGGARAGSAERGSAIPEQLRLQEGSDKDGDPKSIGHEDFLKLMLTQLKNQDPTNPQDTKQMMGQIAQFTTASGIKELNDQFQQFFEHMRSDQSLRAAQLVGREVMTEGNKGYLPAKGDFEAVLRLDSSTPNLAVEIENSSGEVVHQEKLGQTSSGEHTYAWDGTNDSGQRLPQGHYQIRAYREDGDKREAVGTLVGAQVTSVSMGRDGRPPELSVAGMGDIPLSEVERVR